VLGPKRVRLAAYGAARCSGAYSLMMLAQALVGTVLTDKTRYLRGCASGCSFATRCSWPGTEHWRPRRSVSSPWPAYTRGVNRVPRWMLLTAARLVRHESARLSARRRPRRDFGRDCQGLQCLAERSVKLPMDDARRAEIERIRAHQERMRAASSTTIRGVSPAL
jgi:hypothetical protein